MNANAQQQQLAIAAPAIAKTKKAKSRKAPEGGKGPKQSSAFGNRRNIATRESSEPATRFEYVMGPQPKVAHDYIRSVFEPRLYPTRVPNSAGGFEFDTETWRTFDSGTAVAGADGIAIIGVTADCWSESGNQNGVPDTACTALATIDGACGAAAFCSNSAAINYVGFPSLGAAWNTNWNANALIRPTDNSLNSRTRIRLGAMELAVKVELANETAKGEIMLVGSVNPLGGLQGGSINACNWKDIENTNSRVLSRAKRTIANWPSDDEFTVVALPYEAQSFEMATRPTSSTLNMEFGTYGILTLGMIARGMKPGDAISWTLTMNWESELSKTNQIVDIVASPKVTLPDEVLYDLRNNAQKYQAGYAGMKGIHALPWIETLSKHDPMAVQALANHPALPKQFRPAKPHIGYIPALAAPQKPGTFLSGIADLAKSALSSVSGSGILKNVPVVGNALQTLSGWLSNVFN